MSQDIMASFQSNHSALTGAAFSHQQRSRSSRSRKHKKKTNDAMLSSMHSARSGGDFDGMNTTMSMVSTPGGGRVRRAEPSLPFERPESSDDPAMKSMGPGGVATEGEGSGGEGDSELGGKSKKPARRKWFKITGFICCFTGNSKEAQLNGECAILSASDSLSCCSTVAFTIAWDACMHACMHASNLD